MKKLIILFILLLSGIVYGQPPDPNIPVVRNYVYDPNAGPYVFDFKVFEFDAQMVNVTVTGMPWINLSSPVIDPNNMKYEYTGDVPLPTGIHYLLITADDRQAGDTRPLNDPNDLDGPLSAEAYMKFEIVKINQRPIIR